MEANMARTNEARSAAGGTTYHLGPRRNRAQPALQLRPALEQRAHALRQAQVRFTQMVHTQRPSHALRAAEETDGHGNRESVDLLEEQRLVILGWSLARAIDDLGDLQVARDGCANAQQLGFAFEPLDEFSRVARGHGPPSFICIPPAPPPRGLARRAA